MGPVIQLWYFASETIWVYQLKMWCTNLGKISEYLEITSRYINSEMWCIKNWQNFRPFGKHIITFMYINWIMWCIKTWKNSSLFGNHIYVYQLRKRKEFQIIWKWNKCVQYFKLFWVKAPVWSDFDWWQCHLMVRHVIKLQYSTRIYTLYYTWYSSKHR